MEEIKDNKNKKMVYEVPKLVKLNGDTKGSGNGDCIDGSGESFCYAGGSAVVVCDEGAGGDSPPA